MSKWKFRFFFFFLLFRILRDRHNQKDIKVWAVTGGLFGMLATKKTLDVSTM